MFAEKMLFCFIGGMLLGALRSSLGLPMWTIFPLAFVPIALWRVALKLP